MRTWRRYKLHLERGLCENASIEHQRPHEVKVEKKSSKKIGRDPDGNRTRDVEQLERSRRASFA